MMTALLRNPFHSGGVLDKKRSSSPRPISKSPSLISLFDKPTSSHKEHASSKDLAPEQARLPIRIPVGSWDSHMHIVDPVRYPLSSTAVYRPSPHTVSQAVAFETSIGASKIVVVQPSIYGNDNSCLLDALRALGPARARGVVAFDPDKTSLSTLQEWHKLGVRAVRINLQSTGHTMAQDEMESVLRRYADAVRPLNWVIQLYIPLSMVKVLEHIVPTLGVRICIDHMGSPDLSSSRMSSFDPYSLDGFGSLVRLLQGGNTYIKMSAPYRLGKGRDFIKPVESLAREIIRVAGRRRAVFASDWPHTRFEGLDIRPWIEHVLAWCDGDRSLVDRIFRDNAEELWA
ncbi:hypothetical protein VMCG_10130 [Cytospora schulzeri]|uniref:Amidohydrolase-related domain-containing protein n=1 Tax=Cytospora schulzeri TaxID=448051 RepID=A0A423VDH1_9PEZI|nr:hypothetical protein VMCG_10130 [Valsa malicola]